MANINNNQPLQEPFSQTKSFKVFIPTYETYLGRVIKSQQEPQLQQSANLDYSNQPQMNGQNKNNNIDFFRQNPSKVEVPNKNQSEYSSYSSNSGNFFPQIGQCGRKLQNRTICEYGQYKLKSFLPLHQQNAYLKSYNPQNGEQLKKTLFFDERTMSIPQTAVKNPIKEDILKTSQELLQNKSLLNQMFKVKQLNLIKPNRVHQQQMAKGQIKYTYNDYHGMSTKMGYSRNVFGTFYYR